MDHVKSNGSASPGPDRMGLEQPHDESTKIEPTERDILDSDLPELSRQPKLPHSLRIKQKIDAEIDRKPVGNGDAPLSSGFKEELRSVDDKAAIKEVLAAVNTKLEIKLERDQDLNSLAPGFLQNQPKLESNVIAPLHGPGQRSIASPSSPYCRVMINPSWEMSKVYHE
jgi:hypothetical protein